MEWWSYGLSDFLMFSPPVYWRLLARYQQALWPAQALAIAAGLALLALTARSAAARPWLAGLLLAAAWAVTGWAFHWQRYAEIFLAAPWLAAGCWLQALLLAACAPMQTPPQRPAGVAQRAGLGLMAVAVLAYPLLPVAAGQGWLRAEVFGLMPEPTALATLGWLLANGGLATWARVGLAVLPALSLLLGLATRLAMAQ
jgi:hypothetical protein